MDSPETLPVFITAIILLLVVGRGLGEVMTRIGQPAIFGQLLAGVALGPSLFGALFPELQSVIFPVNGDGPAMLDAVSQVGILLLLLLTGMETNLRLVTRKFHVVAMTSVSGIAIPFACGLTLGLLLPADLLPDPERQLVTALFLGTALSISSVKIVAMVLMEVGFIRRDLGQLILATAILDDTIAWILVAIIAGMASRSNFDLVQIGMSLAGVIAFLAIALTIGKQFVARLIRWSNDLLAIEFPVITTILVVTFAFALTTDLIGVHSALGAFIAGVVIGQSPILKGHIESELRGLIIAFFSPVFFAIAGLGMDLTTLAAPSMMALMVGFILVATVGKTLGALGGGLLAGLKARESVALATGLNARGSTEVIVATIGLSMGALNHDIYTLIVAMAVVTTMIMPPTLRWALSRVPMRPEEQERLKKEEADAKDYLPGMERMLVAADASSNGTFALKIAGALAARQNLLTTVLHSLPSEEDEMEAADSPCGAAIARQTAKAVQERRAETDSDKEADDKTQIALDDLITARANDSDEAYDKEIAKGYSFAVVGLGNMLESDGQTFTPETARLLTATESPLAIGLAGSSRHEQHDLPRSIMVPTSGTHNTKLATEIAVALAKSSGGRLTALHVIAPAEESELLRGRWSDPFTSVLQEVRRHAERHGVDAKPLTVTSAHPTQVIRQLAKSGRYDLVVLGIELRRGETVFLGPHTRELVSAIDSPLLLTAD